MRVTTKDAQGNPVGNAAFILKRATSINRRYTSATASVGALTVTDARETRGVIFRQQPK